jgi:hypothetical protein
MARGLAFLLACSVMLIRFSCEQEQSTKSDCSPFHSGFPGGLGHVV